MKKIKNGKLIKEILLLTAAMAGVAGLAFILAALPGLGYVTKEFAEWYRSQSRGRRQAIRKDFAYLRRSRLIEEKEIDGKQIMVLSEKGQKRVLEYKIDEITIAPLRKWDGIWRIVVFDIPERHKAARDALRNKLRLCGFHKLQKSVLVCPYPCRDEIDFLIEFFKVSPYVRLVEAQDFDGAEDVKRRLHLL